MFNRKPEPEELISVPQAGLLEALEGAKDVFAMLAGMRQQAIDAGFSEEIAELIVLELVRKNNG
jgi:hypothetical protein